MFIQPTIDFISISNINQNGQTSTSPYITTNHVKFKLHHTFYIQIPIHIFKPIIYINYLFHSIIHKFQSHFPIYNILTLQCPLQKVTKIYNFYTISIQSISSMWDIANPSNSIHSSSQANSKHEFTSNFSLHYAFHNKPISQCTWNFDIKFITHYHSHSRKQINNIVNTIPSITSSQSKRVLQANLPISTALHDFSLHY